MVEQLIMRVGDMPLYVAFDIRHSTFDIDCLCLDPAFATATATPVCGKFTSEIIRGLRGLNIVGMDVVELALFYDYTDVTPLAAATLGLEMLQVWAEGKGLIKK
ncbi:arginase family protein [Shewanella sp. AC91-MNA-CIBAN-0169]|jgi:agmatinase|uniref:arginase family protein n=1 Tax=Shewanella sp. AC91-MNA-CIBAN-0169 TaxID=3140466 RepID=UPI00331E01C0|tara:strand:+ start:2189 stop:2500 length:312 start_codon:yes stop_codon:yes gene_type:complete